MAQTGRRRWAGGTHAGENVDALLRQVGERAVAKPVDLAQIEPRRGQRLARADDHPPPDRVEVDDVERLADGNADAATLTDRVVDDAVVAAEHAPVDVDDVAGLGGTGLQPLDEVGVAPVGNEADVLAVVLVGDGEAEVARRRARLRLGHGTQREAQEVELLLGGGEQEVALVAVEIDRPVERPMTVATGPAHHVVAGRQRRGAEVARRRQKVGELDRLVAHHARHRRLARNVARGELVDHGLAEALLVVEHVVRDAEGVGDAAGVVDVLTGAAGALAVGRLAVVVELERHPDHIVAGPGFSRAAATEESTPPDMATTMRVSQGRPGRSRCMPIPFRPRQGKVARRLRFSAAFGNKG